MLPSAARGQLVSAQCVKSNHGLDTCLLFLNLKFLYFGFAWILQSFDGNFLFATTVNFRERNFAKILSSLEKRLLFQKLWRFSLSSICWNFDPFLVYYRNLHKFFTRFLTASNPGVDITLQLSRNYCSSYRKTKLKLFEL